MDRRPRVRAMIEKEFEEIGVVTGDVAGAAVVDGLAVVGFRSGGE